MSNGFTNSTYRPNNSEYLEIKYNTSTNPPSGLLGYWQQGAVTIPDILTESDDIKLTYSGYLYANRMFADRFNDYAETRMCDVNQIGKIEPGDVVCELGDDIIGLCHTWADPTAMIVSDTYGFCVGERSRRFVPVALCGRVLAKPKYTRDRYQIGDVVCADDGGVVPIDRRLLATRPDAMIGVVVSIPNYEVWQGVPVNGRIWIKIK